MKRLLWSFVVLLFACVASAAPLELKKGDHICLIGNTLAERMQHTGWMETYLSHRFPQHDLVFRNLGFSGDELTLRLRSQGFGTPDDHLKHSQADVIFAFFGYSESYAGEAGLAKFKQDLNGFITSTLEKKYNGTSGPRLVIFSPIAHEDLRNRNLPDGSENNARLKLYTQAMAEVAAAHPVTFVDLFAPSLELYKQAKQPLTINGIHLNEEGDRLVGIAIDESLFGRLATPRDPAKLARIRTAVLDRNFYWFERYRTVDGYSIYGGRADLKFFQGQTNRVVMDREMEILDVMTANRDRVVWAAAQGQTLKADDSNAPPFLEVISNKQGPLPGGKHVFLSGIDAQSKMNVGENLSVSLFASEEQFPELANPVQMAFDTKGRLWVATMPSYPHWKPNEPMEDKIIILEDTNNDGKADACKVFADGLHVPTGLEFWNNGLFVGQQPDLVFLQDTNNDDKADVRTRVLHGIDSADTHHALNSFVLDPGGALYFQEGTFHHTQVETPYGPSVRNANAAVYRFEPRSFKFEVYVPYGFANPHGHVFERWGSDFVTDGTGNVNYYAAAFSGFLPFPDRHPNLQRFLDNKGMRPCPGTEILTSRHFPPEYQGRYLVANVIGFQGIMQYKLNDQGSGFGAEDLPPLMSSTDANFRPVDMETGPDGALYFIDWQNPIIGHMQHNLRDPSRDRTHGRVYRLTYNGRPLLTPAKIAGEPVEKLLDLLKEPEDRTRSRVRIELSGRTTDEVIPAVDKWLAELNPNDPEFQHHVLEALWVHQSHNVVNSQLLERVLRMSDFRARAAATRVLCYWRDRVSNALDLLKKQAADENPRVRLEAVRAASFFKVPEAIDVPLISTQFASDYYLDYTRKETLRALEPLWKKALAEGRPVAVTSEAGVRFFLRNMPLEQVLKLDRSPVVWRELMFRPGLQDEVRKEGLLGLAKAEGKSETAILLQALGQLDSREEDRDESVIFDLVRLLTSRKAAELAQVRDELLKLTTTAKQPLMRQVAYLAVMNVDGSAEQAWQLGARSPSALRDFLNAVPLISDPNVRAGLYTKIEPLVKALPPELANQAEAAKAVLGRYVKVEIPGRGTLTLAEVEVFSEERNIARQGKASQKTTSNGGEAKRAIDGNKNGSFGAGGQTHTNENIGNPWWEVDLGEARPLDRVVIYNRTDDNLGKRLDGFTLTVLDAGKNVIFRKSDNPAPKVSVEIKLSGEDPVTAVRRAAMNALISVRGQEAKTFQTLAGFVKGNVDRTSAIRALQRIPTQFWPKDDAQPLLDVVLTAVRAIPVADRTTPEALDTLNFAETLSTLLPAADAKKVRAELSELGVRVIRVGTLPERMAYDKDLIVVRAGKPVEFIFENFDLMPHNLVITQPGTLEELGLLAEATAQQPDALARQYVPRYNKLLLTSRLLQPRESEKLSFIAPKQPGVYPIVCTYPGHWRRMYAALYVVDDLDEYLANPEGYLASNPLPIRDELLKDRRPRTEWKFDDLRQAVEEMSSGRSFANGKQMFKVANCVACHKLDGEGNLFGPELAKLDAKLRPVDVLKELIEPSFKINEKYQSYLFELTSGKVLTGLILEQNQEMVKIIENPLAKAEPLVLKIAEIDDQQKSPVSMMPKGLLDKLTRDEILDLVAFVYARGDRNHALFHGAGHHHGAAPGAGAAPAGNAPPNGKGAHAGHAH